MGGASIRLVRHREIQAPIEVVRTWMSETPSVPLFLVNLFHARAECDDRQIDVGTRVRIVHRLGFAYELREARVTAWAPLEVAWLETKLRGEDWFPHAQRITLAPLDSNRCRIENTLTGTFRVPGARWWLVPWYRHVLPWILDLENRRIARAAEAVRGSPTR